MMFNSELNRTSDDHFIKSILKEEGKQRITINLRYENLDEVEKEIWGSEEFLDKRANDLWEYFYLRQTVKIRTNESNGSYIGVDFAKVVHMEVEYDNFGKP